MVMEVGWSWGSEGTAPQLSGFVSGRIVLGAVAQFPHQRADVQESGLLLWGSVAVKCHWIRATPFSPWEAYQLVLRCPELSFHWQ